MNTIYKDYLGPGFSLLSGLARHRVAANAPLLGGISCLALDYEAILPAAGGGAE